MNFPDGVYTVLVTPFNDDLSVNYDDITNWYNHQSKTNVTGLVLLGTTSESPCLSSTGTTHSDIYELYESLLSLLKSSNDDIVISTLDMIISKTKTILDKHISEQLNIVKHVHDLNSKSSTPKHLVVGVGGNNSAMNLNFAKQCIGLCDSFMVTVPHYNKPTQDGICEHFDYICNDPDISKYPVILYNVPSRSGVNAEPSTIKKIYENCKNVVAIKEASGSIDQLIKLRSICPKLKIFAGDDKLILDFLVHGGSGVISVASNIIPITICELFTYDIVTASKLYYTINLPQFIDALFCETNPIPIKYMMCTEGLYDNYNMRLPMTKLSEDKHELVKNALNLLIKYEKMDSISRKFI